MYYDNMKNLEKLISLKSDKNCDDIILFLQNKLKDIVEEIKVFCNESNKGKVVFVGVNTKLQNISPLVLSGHIDTVSANLEKYETNPYVLTKKDDKMFGLGTADMKSFLAVILDNIEIIKKMCLPVVLVLTTDEETTLFSIKTAISKMKELNITPKFTILGEPTSSNFCLSAPAEYDIKVKFFGKSCHSSQPQNGVNAICACAKLVRFIEEKQLSYNLTANCGVVKGGEVINKVPDYAELDFDIRSRYQSDIHNFICDIKQELENLKQKYLGLNCEFNTELDVPAFSNEDNSKIKELANCLNIKQGVFTGACEMGYYAEYAGDGVIFGVGDLALAHKPNEYVETEEYITYSQKLIDVITKVKDLYFN